MHTYAIYLNKTKFKLRSNIHPAVVSKDSVHYTLKFRSFLVGVLDLIGKNDERKTRGRREERGRGKGRGMSGSDLGIYCGLSLKMIGELNLSSLPQPCL